MLCAVMVFTSVPSLNLRAAEIDEDITLGQTGQVPFVPVDENTNEEEQEEPVVSETLEPSVIPTPDESEVVEAPEDSEIPENADALDEDETDGVEDDSDLLVEEDDEEEILGAVEGATFSASIVADEDIGSQNLGISWEFHNNGMPDISNQSNTIISSDTISISPANGTRSDEKNNVEIPATAQCVVVRIQTAGNKIADINDTDNYFHTTHTNDSVADEITPGELSGWDWNQDICKTVQLGDVTKVEVKIHVVKNSPSGGGGEEPGLDNGKFGIHINYGRYIPEDLEPALTVKFNTESAAHTYTETDHTVWDDMPKKGETLPTSVTVSVESKYRKYFQGGSIVVYNDGQRVDSSERYNDLYDRFRTGRATYSYTLPFDPNTQAIEISATFSYARSVSWTYRESERERDNFVENCHIYLLNPDGTLKDDGRLADENFDKENEPERYYQTDFANYLLEIGQKYQFKLVPDKGYQIAGLRINGYTVVADEENTGVFNFTMTDANFHLNGVVAEEGNLEEVRSALVREIYMHGVREEEGEIEGADPFQSKFDCNMGGNYMLSVEDEGLIDRDYRDASNYLDSSQCTDEIMSMYAETSIDIGVEQVVAQDKVSANTKYWEKEITESDTPVEVTLDYKGVEGQTYKIAREHEGKTEILDAVYEDGKLIFTTDKFSKYTILRTNNAAMTKVTIDAPATEDYPAGFFAHAFNVTARVDSQRYDVNIEDGKYVVNVPTGSKVSLTLTSKDGLQKITKVMSDHTAIVAKPDKTVVKLSSGEYNIETKNKTEVVVEPELQPIEMVKLVDADDNDIVLTKGACTLKYDAVFKAYVIKGSEYVNDQLTPKKREDVTFKNGQNIIVPDANSQFTIAEGVLTATGNQLGLAGKKLSLSIATTDKKSYSATINFTAPPTKVTVKGFSNKNNIFSASMVYDTDKKYDVSFSSAADLSNITVNYVDDEGNKGAVIDFGYFDVATKKLYVQASDEIQSINPGDTKKFAFFDGENKIPNDTKAEATNNFAITFTNQLLDNKNVPKKPTVSYDANTTTHQTLGIKLALPKGVSASNHMYYEVVCETTEDTDCPVDENINLTYKQTTTEYFSTKDKVGTISLTDNGANYPEAGMVIKYKVKVQLCYIKDHGEETEDNKWGTDYSNTVEMSTRTMTYAQKISFVRKVPSKIYTGQENIYLGYISWPKETTIREMDMIELINPLGQSIGCWSRWADPTNDNIADPRGANLFLKVDANTGGIYLDTEQVVYDNADRIEGWLEKGKYTIKVTAASGRSIPATCTTSFNIIEGIHYLNTTAPNRIYKKYGSASTFAPTVTYNVSEWPGSRYYGAPATKKVTMTVLKDGGYDEMGAVLRDDVPLTASDPLYGKVTAKNGKITIDKSFCVSSDPADNTFVVKVEAADYAGNTTVAYTAPIEVTSTILMPTTIEFRWPIGENASGGYFYSDISELAIKNKVPFDSTSVNNAQIAVLDQYGNEMEAAISVSGAGYVYDELKINKTGKVKITATTTDGTKKSKSIQFNIVYTDKSKELCVQMYQKDDNANEESDPNTWYNEITPASLENTVAIQNVKDALHPIYIDIGGIVQGNPEGKGLINHKINVTGGKIVTASEPLHGNGLTYILTPNNTTTTVKVTDQTAGRDKVIKTYVITNTKISTKVAPTIKPDKSVIYNHAYVNPYFINNNTDNHLNHVVYTVSKAKNYKKTETSSLIAKVSFVDDGSVIWAPIDENGKFTIDFFGEDQHSSDYISEYPSGKVNFYVTIGEGGTDETNFEPACAMKAMSITVKETPPAPKVTFKTTTIKVSASKEFTGDLDIKALSNAYMIKQYDLINYNTSGFINNFSDYARADETESPVKIKLHDISLEDPNTYITVVAAKNKTPAKVIRVKSWADLNNLRIGKFTVNEDGDYAVNGEMVGNAKQQKDAYKKWEATYLHGYVQYTLVNYRGEEIIQTQSIKLNIVD